MQIECYYLIGFMDRRTDDGKTKLYKLYMGASYIITHRPM